MRTLSLAGRGLTALPRAVFEHADTLEVLDLSGNRLTALPDELPRLARLKVLFASGNPFEVLPPVLGACAALEQVGFRGCGLREVPAEALPPSLRWLTLTDNRLDALPDALGRRPRLQKLMLAGNRLARLPDTLAGAPALELMRLAANRFEALPGWLDTLPRLAWLAWAGNPGTPPLPDRAPVPCIDPAGLQIGALLGEGASGHIHAARWQPAEGGPTRDVAVKRFKGAMTSDGLPGCEMAACLAAGEHPRLAGALGQVGQAGTMALVMPRVPAHWRPLAAPPSLASCSRDVYDPGLRLRPTVAERLGAGVAAAVAHLHERGLTHGDVYAHNLLWDGDRGEAVLSDFGAATPLPARDTALARTLRRFDERAVEVLRDELQALARPGPG